MAIRLLCDARGTHQKRFLDRLLAIAGDEIQLGLHMGSREADFHAPCLTRMEIRNGKRGHLMDGQHYTGANLPLLASADFRQQLETAIDQLYRDSSTYHYRGHNLKNLQDYLDYYHILSDVLAENIVKNNITHALFFMIPHLTYDTILYHVAQSLGVKTVILSQTHFHNQFFSMAKIEDYGQFMPEVVDAPPFRMEKGSAPDLFYMQENWQKKGKTGHLTPRAVGRMLSFLLRKQPLKLLDPFYLANTLGRMKSIYESLPDWRDPFAKFFHTNELAYFEHLAEFEATEVDLSKRFVYVPLHNQPEMSTSSLGGPFRDQLSLIEAVARDLPEGWEIYVKENPRQGAFARGPMFFHRLSRIPSVRFMPSTADTAALAANAQIVATVTGTAGWEAVRKGRPALVFGAAWYQSLPGVHKYREGLDYKAIAATPIDHDQLEKATGALFAIAHPGIVERLYFSLVKEYDQEENADIVARTTLGLLKGNIPFSFGN